MGRRVAGRKLDVSVLLKRSDGANIVYLCMREQMRQQGEIVISKTAWRMERGG